CVRCVFYFFFFQAEDGIRDDLVTGVQTCALPILTGSCFRAIDTVAAKQDPVTMTAKLSADHGSALLTILGLDGALAQNDAPATQIGRASCRERGWVRAHADTGEENKDRNEQRRGR